MGVQLLWQTQKTCHKLVAVGIRLNMPERPISMCHLSLPGVLQRSSASQRMAIWFHLKHLYFDSVCVLQVHSCGTCEYGNGSAKVDLVSIDFETTDGL